MRSTYTSSTQQNSNYLGSSENNYSSSLGSSENNYNSSLGPQGSNYFSSLGQTTTSIYTFNQGQGSCYHNTRSSSANNNQQIVYATRTPFGMYNNHHSNQNHRETAQAPHYLPRRNI